MGRKQVGICLGCRSNVEYNTITSLAESPVEEGLIYRTDDGFIQVSENALEIVGEKFQ